MDKARAAVVRRRASEGVASTADRLLIPHRPLAVHRIADRFGLTPEVAALVAELSGLGPQEAMR